MTPKTPTVIDVKVEALTLFETDAQMFLPTWELRRFDRPTWTCAQPLAKPRNEHALPDLHPLMRAISADNDGVHLHFEDGYVAGLDVRPEQVDLLGEGVHLRDSPKIVRRGSQADHFRNLINRIRPSPMPAMRRIRLPARFLANIAEHVQYIKDHRLSGGIHLKLFPWSCDAQADMAKMGRLWSQASEVSRSATDTLQFNVMQQQSHTATRGGQETVGTHTRGSNFGGSVIFLSGGESESRTRPDRDEVGNWSNADTKATSWTFGGSRANGATTREIDVILTGRLKRASELAAVPPERQPLEVELCLTGDLIDHADRLLSRYRDTTEVAPFDRLIEPKEAHRSLVTLDEIIGFRTAITPARRPPDGSRVLHLVGTPKTLLQNPGDLVSITGPPGAGKTLLDCLLSVRLPAGIKLVLDAEKGTDEQHLYREAGFEVATPACLRARDAQLLGMGPEERRALCEIFRAMVPGGGQMGSSLYDALIPERDLDNDCLVARITELNANVFARDKASGGEIFEAIRERMRMFESDSCDVAHLIRTGGDPIFTPGTKLVVCLQGLTREEQGLFVLSTLVALRAVGMNAAEPTLVILDEMKRVFGGTERDRTPHSETEDTSPQLLGRYLEDLVRGGRQRLTSVFYTDHTLADIPSPVRDRAAYHVFLPRSNRDEIEIFAKECGLGSDHHERLTGHVFSTSRTGMNDPRLCLVGGHRIREIYGQPYLTCLIPGVL